MKYKTILADPPWEMGTMGVGADTRPNRGYKVGGTICVKYPTLTVREICTMPIREFAEMDCHLWLWTTNKYLESGFKVMRAWGFKYLAPITFVKPSGMGAWFIHRTQTLLFGYKDRCVFNKERYKPTVYFFNSTEHSRKPIESYELIESVSDEPRLELFARPHSPLFPKRNDWHVWGDEIKSDIELSVA